MAEALVIVALYVAQHLTGHTLIQFVGPKELAEMIYKVLDNWTPNL